MPQTLRVQLPMPPSVNAMYGQAPGRKRFPTKALKDWKVEAGWLLNSQPRRTFGGPFRIRVLVPQNMRGDVDNRGKAATDLLVAHRIVPDDRYAQSSTVERSDEPAPGTCILIVEAA